MLLRVWNDMGVSSLSKLVHQSITKFTCLLTDSVFIQWRIQTAIHTSCSISSEHFTLIVAVVPLTPCVLKQVQIALYFPIVQTLIQGSYYVLVSGWFEETMDTELRTKVAKTKRTI